MWVFMQQYGQARLAVVDENKGDGYQYDQLGVHHDVFDPFDEAYNLKNLFLCNLNKKLL